MNATQEETSKTPARTSFPPRTRLDEPLRRPDEARHARSRHACRYCLQSLFVALMAVAVLMFGTWLFGANAETVFRAHWLTRVGMVPSTEATASTEQLARILVFYDPAQSSPEAQLHLWRLAYHAAELTENGAELFGVAVSAGKSGAQLDERLPFPWPIVLDHGRQLAQHYAVDFGKSRNPVVLLLDTDGAVRLRIQPQDMHARIEADLLTALAAVQRASAAHAQSN